MLNPKKRLAAEVRWFLEADKEGVQRIYEEIEQKRLISTNELSTLSKMNAMLYNFSILPKQDISEITNDLFELDKQYSLLDIQNITLKVNENREIAGFSMVEEKDVSEQINRYREDLRLVISEGLITLKPSTYIQVATIIAENEIINESFSNGVVMENVINQYEIKMQSTINKISDEILAHCSHIFRIKDNKKISVHINDLIKQIQEWDTFVQPIQLKSKATGVPHELSDKIVGSVQKLALWLHNHRGLVIESYKLLNEVKPCFVELTEIYSKLDNESKNLKDLISEIEEPEDMVSAMTDIEEPEEIKREMVLLSSYADSLKNCASNRKVNSFVIRVTNLDNKVKLLSIKKDVRNRIRELLLVLALNVAITINYEQGKTSLAVIIVEKMAEEFQNLDLSDELSERFFEVKKNLSMEKLFSNPYKKVKRVILVILLIGAIYLFVSFVARDLKKTDSSYSDSAYLYTIDNPSQ